MLAVRLRLSLLKKIGKRARRCSTMQDKQDNIEGPDE